MTQPYSPDHLQDDDGNFLFVRETIWQGPKTPGFSLYHPLEGWHESASGARKIPIFDDGKTEQEYLPEGITFTVLKEVVFRAEGMNEPVAHYENYRAA